MKFRIKRTEDTKLILKLDRKCMPTDSPVEVDGVMWWVAVTENGEAVGYGGSYNANCTNNVLKCILHRAGVVPAHRGHGLQKRLIKARTVQARKDKCIEVVTYTSTDNPASGNSLIGCGFKLYYPPSWWGFKYGNYWKLVL